MSILKLNHVNFTYDNERYVLKDINMEFDFGIVYGIFGRSGAGKTTLLSLLAGLDITKEGTITYQDKDLSVIGRDHYRCNDIGIIFQSYNLLPHLTAVENVLLSMNISSKQEENKEQKAIALLQKVGLDEKKINRRVLQLSGGEQQRVSIARALSYDANVILADEPTGNLDKETEEEIIDLLIRLAHDDQKCVIIVSHSTKIKKQVDHLYHLVNGKLET